MKIEEKDYLEVRIGNCRHYMDQIVELAELVYKKEDVSPMEKYLAMYDKSPESFIVVFDHTINRVVGYTITLPLTKEYYKKTLNPLYDESDLTLEDIRPFSYGVNDVYFFSIVNMLEHPDRVRILKLLGRACGKQFKQMAIEGKYIIEASAIALSPAGEKICLGLNMNKLGENSKGIVYATKNLNKFFVDEETRGCVVKNFIKNKNKAKEQLNEKL